MSTLKELYQTREELELQHSEVTYELDFANSKEDAKDFEAQLDSIQKELEYIEEQISLRTRSNSS